jgi:hypothetical protein
MSEEIKSSFPLNLFLESYNDEFHTVLLEFYYTGCETNLDSNDKRKFILWMFDDMVQYMLQQYDDWKNKLLHDGNILGYEMGSNERTFQSGYELKKRTMYYINNIHTKYSIIKLTEMEYLSVLNNYTRFMFERVNNRDGNYESIGSLFTKLFDNYKEKFTHIGNKNFDQRVECFMCDSKEKMILMNLIISRDYFRNENLIEKYLLDDNSFERKYFDEFNAWYTNIRTLTNNFDKNTFDKYVNSKSDEQIRQDFNVPNHENELLVDYMIKKFDLKSIPYTSIAVLKTGNILIEKTYTMHGANFLNMNYDRCFVKINELIVG